MISYIEEIHSLGYKVSIDDVATGQDTLELVLKNIDSISSLKFPLRAFKELDLDILLLFLDSWHGLAKRYGKTFIVEGVENERVAKKLYDRGIVWQQGYYWGKSVELS